MMMPLPTNSFALVRRHKLCGVGFHFGVGTPDGRVVDLRPEGFRVLTPGEFSEGQTIKVLRVVAGARASAVAARLRQEMAIKREYDPIGWNCESFARFVLDGERHSNEVVAWAATGVAVALLLNAWV